MAQLVEGLFEFTQTRITQVTAASKAPPDVATLVEMRRP